MLTKDFTFDLPEDRVATHPQPNRTDSRLLAMNRTNGDLSEHKFSDLLELTNSGDLLVINDSKVLAARLHGHKASGGKIEMLIERIVDAHQAWAHVRASKSPKPGTWLIFADDVMANVVDFNRAKGLFLLSFQSKLHVLEILHKYGEIPLPPYMQRAAESADKERYQTVYAQHPGSVAAPTAGLHFNDELLAALQNKGVEIGRVTLHIGAGTFQPVRVAEISQHKMHSEQMYVDEELCAQIAATKQRGGRVICVGTTAVRALESAALSGELKPKTGATNIFITPGFNFKVVDALITNFHLPESTLLMLVCAFAGKQNTLAAYQYAVDNNYRFYSYGDAMFITGDQHAV